MDDKRIKKAVSLAQRGNLKKALQLLGRIAGKEPGNFDAQFYYGTFLSQSGDPNAAIPALARASELDPGAAGVWSNLGMALMSAGRTGEARAAFEKAISLAPELVEPQINVAYCFYLEGDYGRARSLAQNLVERGVGGLSPKQTFGLALRRLGKVEDAERVFKEVLAADPDNMTSLNELANMYAAAGRDDEARQYFEKILSTSPGDEGAAFALRVLNREELDRVPVDQVRKTFDGMANTFDAHLGHLGYRAPAILADMVDFADGPLRALDLGCGTGQVGDAIRDRCSQIVGVDLSEQMVAQARSKGVYDRLAVDEVVHFLEETPEEFDVTFCCDTLIYVGALDDLFSGVAKRLAPRGQFLFTTEPLQEGSFAIQQTGRFAYSRAYIEELARRNGFTVEACKTDTGRMEMNSHIPFEYYRLVRSAA